MKSKIGRCSVREACDQGFEGCIGVPYLYKLDITRYNTRLRPIDCLINARLQVLKWTYCNLSFSRPLIKNEWVSLGFDNQLANRVPTNLELFLAKRRRQVTIKANKVDVLQGCCRIRFGKVPDIPLNESGEVEILLLSHACH